MEPLKNSIHEKFAQAVVSGIPLRDAYMQCYPASSKKSAGPGANRLIKKLSVQKRIDFLKQQNAEISAWTRSDSMTVLMSIAKNPNKKDNDRISAVDLLNRMLGYSEPDQKLNIQQNIFQFLSPDRGKKEIDIE